MKKTMLMTALASAVVLMFAGPTSAGTNVTRTVPVTYEFHSLGHGDLGGFCLAQPSNPPGFGSCMEIPVEFGEDFVSVELEDNTGAAVYFSVQQEDNPSFAVGCGSVVDFPVVDSGPGGAAAPPVTIFPWVGPGINDGVTPCNPGSTNGGGGSGTATFYNDVPN